MNIYKGVFLRYSVRRVRNLWGIVVIKVFCKNCHFLRVYDSFAVSLFDVDWFYAGVLYIGKLYFPVGRRFHLGVIAALNLLRRSIKDIPREKQLTDKHPH